MNYQPPLQSYRQHSTSFLGNAMQFVDGALQSVTLHNSFPWMQ